MTRIIAIANQKGGVGKTTTTLNLGATLQEDGKKVLLIDLDPQGSLTTSLGLDPESLEETIYNTIISAVEGIEEFDLEDIMYETDPGMDLVPANLSLSSAEMDLFRATMREFVLREIFEKADLSEYDFVLIDCPPNLGILTINALAAAQEVVIPLQAEYLALKGVNQLMRSIFTVQKKINKDLRIAGVLLTMADFRTRHTRTIVKSAHEALGGKIKVFDTVIKENVRFKDASLAGETILAYPGGRSGAIAYRAFAQEVLHG